MAILNPMTRRVLFFVLLWVGALGAPAAEQVRVVSQFVGGDELLLALAEPGQIAGLSHLAHEAEFSAVAEEAKKYPQVVRGDAEAVLKYAPTLVLFADYSRGELVEQIRRTGIKTIVFERYHNLEDAFANLRLLAKELGPKAEARAEAIVADSEVRLRVLAERLKNVKPVRVIAPSTYGVVGGADTTFQDMCDHAGAINLAATLGGLRGHEPPPNEKMLTWPIDKVVVAGKSVDEALAPFLALPPYKFLAAVKEKRAALIEPYMLSSVTHHRVEGYERLARELHPGAFE